MATQHLKCEQLLKDTNAEYERLIDALNGLISGEMNAEEVNAISNDALERVDSLINNYMEGNT